MLHDAEQALSSPCLLATPWRRFPVPGFVAMAAALATLVLDFLTTRSYEAKHRDGAARVKAAAAAALVATSSAVPADADAVAAHQGDPASSVLFGGRDLLRGGTCGPLGSGSAIRHVHPTSAETCWSGCGHPLFYHDPVTFSVVWCSTSACAGARFGRGHAGDGAVCSWFPYYTCLRGARSLAASMLAAGLLVHANPPPVPLVREDRAPFL
jgi:hypothetical protein